jgi:hypothetical protein
MTTKQAVLWTLAGVSAGALLYAVTRKSTPPAAPPAPAPSPTDTAHAPGAPDANVQAHNAAVAAASALILYLHTYGCETARDHVLAFQTAYNADPAGRQRLVVNGAYNDLTRAALADALPDGMSIPTCAMVPDRFTIRAQPPGT